MSIARFELRNEYALGHQELYRNVDREDPKAILDGVAVSGLVGILRQLGDLAEFAAEIFHDIEEEVMTTASRSNKLMIRLQHIEATVPSLEKTMLAQTSHIHFAYTAGREWHPHLPNEQNHFICYDLPRVIMNSYEECRDPPRLHLLDKFDIDGPGSCLKRYSDPTYFRRASGKPIEATSDFLNANKKSKIKKKKSLQRNRDISRLASAAKHSGRKSFISLNFSGRTTSSKTSSTIDSELKSDLQDHSRSFDSRSGSGYIEHLSTATSSVKTEEKLPEVYSSSSLTPGALTIASVLSECHCEDADDNFSYCLSHKQAGHGSSCVSGDEKVEIAESNGLQHTTDEAPKVIERSSIVDAPGEKTTCEGKTGGADFLSSDNEVSKSVSSLQQYAEIEAGQDLKDGREIEREQEELGRELEMDSEQETESEGDTFVDALNTIESDLDNDYVFQTSQEVPKESNDITKERLETATCERGLPCLTEQEREQNLNNVEDSRLVDGLKDHSLGNDQTSFNASDVQENTRISSRPETLSSPNASDKLISQDSGVAFENQSSQNYFSAGRDGHGDSKGEYDVKSSFVSASGDSLSGSSNSLRDNGMQEHQEIEAEVYRNSQPISIWTNGSLLGLQPSKPLVFAMPKTEDTKRDKSGKVVGNSSQLQTVPSDNTSEKASRSFADSYANDEKSGYPMRTHANRSADDVGHQRENHEIVSGVSDLSHRLIMDGFHINTFARDRRIVPATIPENVEVTGKSGFSGQDTKEKTFKEPFRDETPFNWLTSSPPLEHMKISFNPAESRRISKLKLKFPYEIRHHEDNKDTFSSFQLVPEPATSVPDLDSDDNTFCRSSPYMSDNDYPSDNDSMSSSKQWEESSHSSGRKDQELYDLLHRSTHAKHDAEPSSLSTQLLNVPSFETLKPSLQMERTKSSVSEDLSYLQSPAEPLPPPLPPVQWRVSKQSTERSEDKQQSFQDELKRVFDKKSYASTGSQHSSTARVDKEHPSVASTVPKPENIVHQTNNGREDKQNVNVKEAEAGDFLHQIRMKQFNLRRVVTTRPSTAATTGPVPSINKILEKANSIRQAVASEDGDESDTWSDT